MVEDFAAGRFEALVCWDLDRLTRQPRQLEDWIDAAEERGLRLVTANGEADLGTDGGRMYARIKAAVARSEMERKGARQTRALRQRAELGRPPKGTRLTGYTTNGDVVPAEAATVRAIFDAFAAGSSLRSITVALNGEPGNGHGSPCSVLAAPPRRGKPWSPSTVRDILLNPRYAGRSVYKGQPIQATGGLVRGTWEPVVEEAIFDAVQDRLNDPARRSNRVGTDRRHLGSGLYLCGICDRPVRSHSGSRYRCASAHVLRALAPIDLYVCEVIRARLARSDLADLLPNPGDDEVQRIDSEALGLRNRLGRARADYKAEKIDADLYNEIRAETEAALDKLAAERIRRTAGSAASAVLAAPSPVAAFDAADLGARRAVLDALAVVRIYPAQRGRRAFDPDTVKIEPK